MRILVIGSDSFIASNFINRFKDIHNILGVSIHKSKYENEIIYSDIFDIEDSCFSDKDVIINFSAIVHNPPNITSDIISKINYQLPVFLLEKSIKYNVKTFIQMSTLAVYGDQKLIDYSTVEKPKTDYAKSKLEADIQLLNAICNTNICIVRPPMVYGGENAPGNIDKLIKLISVGIPLPFNKINNERHFIHVKNLTDFLNYSIENLLSGIFLPCDQDPISTTEMVKAIKNKRMLRTRFFSLPYFLRKLLNKIKPELYNKLFGDLIVTKEIYSKTGFMPKYNFVDHFLEN